MSERERRERGRRRRWIERGGKSKREGEIEWAEREKRKER